MINIVSVINAKMRSSFSKAIMGFAYKHFNTKMQVFLFKCFNYNSPCGYGDIYKDSLINAFDTFLSEKERNNRSLLKQLKNDAIYCWCKYMALPNEYFLYGFRYKNEKERSEYQTDMDRIRSLRKTIDYQLFLNEINDKFNFYKRAGSFFCREAIKISGFSDLQAFFSFIKLHPRVFCKPLNGSKGVSVKTFELSSGSDANLFFSSLLDDGREWIVEEKIDQAPEMAFWNQSSVNTIRVPSFLRNGQHTVTWTVMRIGRAGAIIDNAAAGGIIVAVDSQTGLLVSDGIDESAHHIKTYSNLNIDFRGWQVPRWKELLEVVERIHRELFPHHIYIAFDFALTDNGWVLVEGNWGQLLYQIVSGIGLKKRFHELIGV